MATIRCICINDKNIPKEIPKHLHIKLDVQYNITHLYRMKNQNDVLGIELAEINFTDECLPYNCYLINRVAIFEEDLPLFVQMMKDTAQLNDITLDINKLFTNLKVYKDKLQEA